MARGGKRPALVPGRLVTGYERQSATGVGQWKLPVVGRA